jgi:mannose-6-phosphate isomerase-like protein (cupin superfamily)
MRRAQRQPVTESIVIYAGIYYKVWRVPDRGTIIPQHAHEHDHITALLRGVVRVTAGGNETMEISPATIRIPAGVKHRFHTMTDDCVLACIHNADHLRDDEPAVREEHQIMTED